MKNIIYYFCKELKIKFYILISLFIISYKGFSNFQFPQYSFKYFDNKNGLKGTEIYNISQDNNGLLWLGTNNGLVQFDGFNFFDFENHKQENKNPPIGNYRNILKHSSGNIWIATDYSGVSEYNFTTKTFKHYNPKNKSKNNVADIATYLIREDENKNIWFAHYFNGISFFNYQTKTFEYLKYEPNNINSLLSNEIFSICCDLNGGIWIGYKNAGLSYYHFKTKTFKHYTTENKTGLSSNNIFSISIDHNKTLWIGSNKGIVYKTNLSNSFESFKINELKNKVFYNSFFNFKNNLLYIVSSDGLHVIEPNSMSLKIYKLYPDEPPLSNKNRCTNLFFDQNNHLWIQFNQGFCLATENIKKLKPYNDLMKIGEKNRLCFFEVIKDEIVYSIKQNQLIIKSIYSNTINKVIPLEMPKNMSEGSTIIYFPNQYSNYLLIKIQNKILYTFNIKTHAIERIQNLKNGETISENKIYDALIDSKGNIWAIDKNYGIIRYSQNEKKWLIINPNNEKTNTDFFYYPTKFREDKFGNIWVINPFYGILKYEKGITNNFKIVNFKSQLSKINNLFSIYYSITEDNKGNLYFAGNGKQLDYYHAENNRFYSIKREGCFSDITTSLHIDKVGNLWCFNQQSIYKIFSIKFEFNKILQNKFEYRSYDWKNGFDGNYFGNNYVFETVDGSLYFDSKESLQHMQPSKWDKEFHSTKTLIHKFIVYGKKLENYNTKPIVLPYNQNNIEFQFTSNSIVNAQNNIFKYKLLPYDIEWRYTTMFSPKAVYNNLNAGKYTFIVNSAGSDAVWHSKNAQINFKIQAHFSSSVWFKVLIAIIFLIVFFLIYLLRINRIKKQEKLKTEYNKKIAELESKALRSQMNPHFVFNSLNSIQNYIMKNDVESSSKYLNRFAKLTRLIFNHSQQQFISLEQELIALKTYVELEQFRFKNKFDFLINIDSKINQKFIEIPPLIIQPFIENSIWHGIMHNEDIDNFKGQITLDISQINNFLLISIKDNGIGRKKSSELNKTSTSDHHSSGMKLTKDRLDILNFNNKLEITTQIIDLYNDNKQSEGTQIIIKIPIN